MRRAVLALGLAMLTACSVKAATTGSSPAASASPAVRISVSALPDLVGEWQFLRTCAALVKVETDAHLTDLITFQHLAELIDGSVNEANWDPSRPCAGAKPPTEHSHTFWANGAFNSYDENGRQVDQGTYTIDGHNFTISNPDFGDWTFNYRVTGETIAFDVVIPKNCTATPCREGLAWAFSVAFPGQSWTRVTSGPDVPPGTGSSG